MMNSTQALSALLLAATFPAQANDVPGLPPAGQAAYREFQNAPAHRAFAIAPGGAWGWQAGTDSLDQAEDRAVEACRSSTRQSCVLYASDERVVFDKKSWSGLWGPYANATSAAKASTGREPGQRLFDIAYRNPQGAPATLGRLRGKVVLVHFWGSWCAPCRKEIPELATLYKALADRRDVAFVFLQVREPIGNASRWVTDRHLELPLSDSGSSGEDDAQFRLAGGGTVPDREIARSFPTTYVLDKHGLVIFSHVGPVHDWSQYEALLRDAANRSGK